jgi:diadenosine tetraphosphate (Ap4A) HIT family hydrolase
MFRLDAAFLEVSEALTALPLCEVRLMADARFAWLVLIPRVADAVEMEDLSGADRERLVSEVVAAGRAVRAVGEALGRPVQKLNVGQLGNVTRQLHVHVVGRRTDDACWPGPVWGQGVADRYGAEALEVVKRAALATFGL